MTHLMVSPFAPYRDGIAAYAVQEVRGLRDAGIDVEVLSPIPSAAHHHLVIGSPQGMHRLSRFVRGYERVVIQAYPELLFGSCPTRLHRLVAWDRLAAVARAAPTELRLHELDYATIDSDPITRRLAARALRQVESITVHTESERDALLGVVDGPIAPIEIVDHGAHFRAATSMSKSEARESLGIPTDTFVFCCIGFVQQHKGFDRAVRAFDRLGSGDHRIYVVGDARVDHPAIIEYRDELDRLIRSVDGAERRAGYVSDEEFDRWLVASDRVVLPYHAIWSSGVVERAALYDTPVIATDVGGLRSQLRPGSVVVFDDRALADAMARAAGTDVTTTGGGRSERHDLERVMRTRAGTGGVDGDQTLRDRILAVTPAHLGNTNSVRPGVRHVKRMVQRITAWEFEPVVEAVNQLQKATAAAVDRLEQGRTDDQDDVRDP